jgi:site-specific DNA recombinase
MNTKKRAIGYGRVSTEGQLKGTSRDYQEKRTREAAEKDGCEFTEFISDDGRSGKSIKGRKGLQKVIKYAKARELDVLYFTKPDRLARNLRDTLNVWDLLIEKLGREIVCTDEPAVNSVGKMGKVMLQFLGIVAEMERDWIRERTESGRKIVWKEGESFIGQPPYGYRWDYDEKKIVPDEETRKIYERIVSMYLDQNMTYKDIAIQLTKEGIPPPSARRWAKRKAPSKWNATTVGKILKNPAYKGKAIQNRFVHLPNEEKGYHYTSKEEKPREEWITIKFPPLISDERWDQIQAMIKHRKGRPKKRHKGYEDHFLAENILRCGECGGRMTKKVQERAGGSPLFRYICYWKRCSAKELEASGREKCILKSLDAEVIDKKILNEVSRFISNPSKFADDWLRDLDLEEIQAREEHLKKKEKELKDSLDRGFEYIRGAAPELTERYRKQMRSDEELYFTTQRELKKAERELDFATSKKKRVTEFGKIAKRSSRWAKKGMPVSTMSDCMQFFKSLPFKERKRIIEAIIAPENGGKCEIRYLRLMDLLDSTEGLSREELVEPMVHEPPDVETNFHADLDRIEALITGLDRSELKNKLTCSGIT